MDNLVQRVATDGGSRVLMSTTLFGAREIDKIEKFLLPLQCKKAPIRRLRAFVFYKW